MSDRPEEKLRSEIIQHIHDWIKGGMGEADWNTARIDEMIAGALLKAREDAFEECEKLAEMVGQKNGATSEHDEYGFGVEVAARDIASAIRQHSQKGER